MDSMLWFRTTLRLFAALAAVALLGKSVGAFLDGVGMQPGLLMGSVYVAALSFGWWVMWDVIDPFLHRERAEGLPTEDMQQNISRPKEIS